MLPTLSASILRKNNVGTVSYRYCVGSMFPTLFSLFPTLFNLFRLFYTLSNLFLHFYFLSECVSYTSLHFISSQGAKQGALSFFPLFPIVFRTCYMQPSVFPDQHLHNSHSLSTLQQCLIYKEALFSKRRYVGEM